MAKYRGKKQHRPAHPKIFVWSHTRIAEFEYFQDLKHYLKTTLLIPKKKICWDPWKMIDTVIAWKQNDKAGKQEICEEDGDQIWCIFDVDDFYKNQPKKLLNAIKKAHQNNIRIAYTNECFELWLLMHLEKPTSFVKRNALEKKIQQAFKKNNLGHFKKNKNVFMVLQKFQHQGIKHAKELINRSYDEIDWEAVLSDAGNPSTSVHFLIQEILDKLRNNS